MVRVSSPPPSDERELLGDPLLHRGLLHREADIGHSELLGVGQSRIFRNQIDARRVDRLPVNRNGIGQAERIHARLAVAVGDAAVHQRHALDPARQVERPRHRIGIGGIDPGDGGHFRFRQILVPAELLQARQREFRIAVLDLRILGVGAIRQQADLSRRAVGKLLLALDAETRPERAAAVHHAEICVVEQRRTWMLDFR